MRPLIGITTGEIKNLDSPWSPITYGQSYTYSDSIIRAGGIPVLIPMTTDIDTLQQLYDRLDGILFAGGNDIDPKLYKAKPLASTKDISAKRDDTEVHLLDWALEDHKPILAICRGMQLLNVFAGGTLYQDIPLDLPEASDHELSTLRQDGEYIAHKLNVKPSSKFADIIKAEYIKANSHHHQAIKDLGNNLTAVGWSDDGIIEIIENDTLPFVIGVQCHPESLQAAEPKWNLVFRAFVHESTPS